MQLRAGKERKSPAVEIRPGPACLSFSKLRENLQPQSTQTLQKPSEPPSLELSEPSTPGSMWGGFPSWGPFQGASILLGV